jgi:hypothetical protein
LDLRGRGSSFGTVYAGRMENEANRWDLYDVIEWLAAQPWSDGAIGMCGCSYVGKTQFLAASVMPPLLKAIAPTRRRCHSLGLQFCARIEGSQIVRDLHKHAGGLRKTSEIGVPRAEICVDQGTGGPVARQIIVGRHMRDAGAVARVGVDERTQR